MRVLLLSTAALLGMGLAAHAADMPMAVSEPAIVAPIYDWSGFYAGVHVGYGWGDSDLSSPLDDVIDPAVDNDELDTDGVFGGGQAGFNFQTGNFVFGIEADISGTGIDGDVVIDPIDLGGGGSIVDADINWLATVRGRLGYAFGNVLPYVTGGFAAADVDVSANDLPFGLPDFDDSDTFTGWTVGGGVEVGFTEHLSAKIEYLYADLGDETFVLDPATEGAEVTGDLTLQTIKAGLNYRF